MLDAHWTVHKLLWGFFLLSFLAFFAFLAVLTVLFFVLFFFFLLLLALIKRYVNAKVKQSSHKALTRLPF